MPYFPGRVPAETVAAMAAVSRDIVRAAGMPVGINVLRSDGEAAIAIAAASGAHYVRVNVHTARSWPTRASCREQPVFGAVAQRAQVEGADLR